MTTIRTTNDRLGDITEITAPTLEAAVAELQAIVRECGLEFSHVTIGPDDYEIVEA